MNNYYNEEESSRNNLIEDLKNLPKIKAPDDFEFNLMTRIQNKNFGNAAQSRERFNLLKFLAPSAVVAAAVLLFFIFYPKSQLIQTPNLSQQPPSVTTPTAAAQKSESANSKEIALNSPIKRIGEESAAHQNKTTVDNAARQTQNLNRIEDLIHSRNSISLDDYISGDISNQKDLARGSVVTSEDQTPNFDGFFVKQKTDPATLKRYREVVDSLKKAQMKLDSLKKASKLP